jgi:hypothetical protein
MPALSRLGLTLIAGHRRTVRPSYYVDYSGLEDFFPSRRGKVYLTGKIYQKNWLARDWLESGSRGLRASVVDCHSDQRGSRGVGVGRVGLDVGGERVGLDVGVSAWGSPLG